MTELEFAQRLKTLRKANNLTQQELADRLGVSNKSVSRWETGGYPDVAMLGPLARALGVTVDDLLGESPPIRTLKQADWQNLLSFVFAIGGGVLFFLFDLFAPALVCYALYLGAMAYGVYLQRHYTYHSRWFLAANTLTNLFVNFQLLLPLAALSVPGLEEWVTELLAPAGAPAGSVALAFLPRLLLGLTPYLLCGVLLTALTAWAVARGQSARRFPLQLDRSAFSRTKAIPALVPLLCAGFYLIYHLDTPETRALFQTWVYTRQELLFYLLLGLLTLLAVVWLLLKKHRGMVLPALACSLLCALFPSLARTSRALSLRSGKILLAKTILNTDAFPRFDQLSWLLAVAAVVLAGAYLLCCLVTKREKP